MAVAALKTLELFFDSHPSVQNAQYNEERIFLFCFVHLISEEKL
jgi:hypothetical protein